MSIHPRASLLLGLCILMMLSSCSPQAAVVSPAATTVGLPSASPLPPSPTVEQATPTLLPATNTVAPSTTPTSTASQTLEPTPSITATATATVRSGAAGGAVVGSVLIFLIRQETGGPLCGDSAIPVSTLVKRTGDIARDVEAGLNLLFSIDEKMVQDLYNPIYKASLKVVEVEFYEKTGFIDILIRGTYPQPKDPCDNTRVREQVWQTVKQFEEIKSTNIILNGYPFGDKLSNGK